MWVFVEEVYGLLGFVHLGMGRLCLITIVNTKIFLVTKHVDLLEHFSLEVRKGLIPDFELECLFIYEFELDGQALS